MTKETHTFSETVDSRASVDRINAPGLRETIRACTHGKSPWPLFLHGLAGTGKTKACEALVLSSGGWFTNLSTLCRQLTQADKGELHFNMNGIGWRVMMADIYQDIKTYPLLVVDEIGLRGEPTPHQYETLKFVLDWRVDRNVMPTILISNIGPTAIRKVYDDRVISRVTCGTVMEVVGPDLRIQ